MANIGITIEREDCTSCGSCWDVCAEVFEENDSDGFAQVTGQYQVGGDPGKGEVPEDLRECAEEGADVCPVEIIHVQA
jgi:ferredoxin